jgi:hypothetical protein
VVPRENGNRPIIEALCRPPFPPGFAARNRRFRGGDFRTSAGVHHGRDWDLQPFGDGPPTRSFLAKPDCLIPPKYSTWTPEGLAVGSRRLYARDRPFSNKFFFEFGESAHDGEHKSSHRAAFFRTDVLGDGWELDAQRIQFLNGPGRDASIRCCQRRGDHSEPCTTSSVFDAPEPNTCAFMLLISKGRQVSQAGRRLCGVRTVSVPVLTPSSAEPVNDSSSRSWRTGTGCC